MPYLLVYQEKRINLNQEDHLRTGIKMTRCEYLDHWFDVKSKEIDLKEKETEKCFVTGEKK